MLNPPRKSFVMLAAFAMTLLVACAIGSVWLLADAGFQDARAKALAQRAKEQASVAADFYLASMNRDTAAMTAAVSPDDAELLRAHFGGEPALGMTFERQWEGEVLVARTSGAWGETMRYEFTGNGGKREAIVAIGVYVPVEQGDEAQIAHSSVDLRLKKGRWVVTGVDGKTIEEMY